MSLQNRDYYKEKLKDIEREESKRSIFVIGVVLLIILALLLSLIIF